MLIFLSVVGSTCTSLTVFNPLPSQVGLSYLLVDWMAMSILGRHSTDLTFDLRVDGQWPSFVRHSTDGPYPPYIRWVGSPPIVIWKPV